MGKKYITPEFEYKKVKLLKDVLSVSNPEVTIPEEIGTLPRGGGNSDW